VIPRPRLKKSVLLESVRAGMKQVRPDHFAGRLRMRNDEELERPSGSARRASAPARPRPRSIAKRLFFSAALLSFVILLVAGLVLSTIYRRTAETNFDERLGVYLHTLVADIATPGEDSRTWPGQLGEAQFELALSGWYWQVTRLAVP